MFACAIFCTTIVIAHKFDEYLQYHHHQHCTDVDARLRVLDAEPFARGFAKAAFHAQLDGVDVVLKRPHSNAEDDVRRFRHAAGGELGKLALLQSVATDLMLLVLACLRNEPPFYLVERLYPMDRVRARNTPLCARLAVAHSVAALLQGFQTTSVGAIVGCDLKANQFGLSSNMRARLLDLNSLGVFDGDESPHNAHRACSIDEECHSYCFKIERAANILLSENECDHARGRCFGHWSASNVFTLTTNVLPYVFGVDLDVN